MQLRRFAPHGLMISQKKIKSTGKVGNRRYSAPLHKNMEKNARALSGTRITFHCAASVNHPTRFSLPMYILPGNALYCFRLKRLSRSEEYPWTSPRLHRSGAGKTKRSSLESGNVLRYPSVRVHSLRAKRALHPHGKSTDRQPELVHLTRQNGQKLHPFGISGKHGKRASAAAALHFVILYTLFQK